jgi:tetratricopeptide (TPR) repeat protein
MTASEWAVVSVVLVLGLIAGVAAVAARLRRDPWAGRKVFLHTSDVPFGHHGPDWTFIRDGVFDTAVVVVTGRRGSWLGVRQAGKTVWFLAEAAVPLEQAPAYFDRLIRDYPGQPSPWVNRGLAFEELGQIDQAIADYTEAIRLDPGVSSFYLDRGRAWTGKEAHDRAEADFTTALRLAPSSAETYLARGWARRMLKKLALALEDYNAAACITPTDPWPLLGRSAVLADRRRYREAAKDLEEALRLGPGHTEAINYLAWFLATCPDPAYRDGERAVGLALQACERAGRKGAGLIDTLAVAHAEAGHFDEAIRFQRQALDAPDFPAGKRGEALGRLESFARGQPYRE